MSAFTPVYDWPLASSSRVRLRQRTSSATDARLKRALENDSRPPLPIMKDVDARAYLLYLRDELPPSAAAALAAFLASSAEGVWHGRWQLKQCMPLR